MDVSRIISSIPETLQPQSQKVGENNSGTGFAAFLENSINNTVATDFAAKDSNLGLMTGDLTDLHTATIEAQKANITLNLTMSIRTRVIESYKEIMSMQV